MEKRLEKMPEYIGGPLDLMRFEAAEIPAERNFEDEEFAELLELALKKETAIDRFIRISARFDREENAWRKFEEIQNRRELAALN